MKYEAASSFEADFKRLSATERALFLTAIRMLNEAFARRGDRPLPRWPAALRIKQVRGAPGIWEMAWSFSGPDGRATFEFVSVGGEPGIRWRRIGDHRIFREP